MTGSRLAAFTAACLIAAASVTALAQSGDRSKLSAPPPVNPRQTGNNTFQFALQNGMQVARRRRFFELSCAKSHAFAQSKRAARIEQLLRERGIYECDVPEAAVEKQ